MTPRKIGYFFRLQEIFVIKHFSIIGHHQDTRLICVLSSYTSQVEFFFFNTNLRNKKLHCNGNNLIEKITRPKNIKVS